MCLFSGVVVAFVFDFWSFGVFFAGSFFGGFRFSLGIRCGFFYVMLLLFVFLV